MTGLWIRRLTRKLFLPDYTADRREERESPVNGSVFLIYR